MLSINNVNINNNWVFARTPVLAPELKKNIAIH